MFLFLYKKVGFLFPPPQHSLHDVLSFFYIFCGFPSCKTLPTDLNSTIYLIIQKLQGIVYYDEENSHSRGGDDSIAYTWLHFLEDDTNNTDYVLYMPMTKAGVRSMDVVSQFLTSDTAPQEIQDANLNPTQWGVAGASKRGWTAWLVASVDPR